MFALGGFDAARIDGWRPSCEFILVVSVRFQVDLSRKFSLINAESLANVAELPTPRLMPSGQGLDLTTAALP